MQSPYRKQLNLLFFPRLSGWPQADLAICWIITENGANSAQFEFFLTSSAGA
jgi:hypothetical protein